MDLQAAYSQKKPAIEKRLQEFREVFDKDDKQVFDELAFCLCTPQSRARNAWSAIEKMRENSILYNGSADEILKWMAGVRFNINKSRYIYETRESLKVGNEIKIKHRIDPDNVIATREWLVTNIKGFGYKEASHFLRNIGFGENIAILDRHILKHMVKNKVINEIPKYLSAKQYKELEQKFISFAHSIDIPPAHLDLLFWSEEAGEIFK